MSIDITTLALAKEYTNRMVGSGGTGGGVNGKDGITPHIGDNGNWFIGTVDTGISAQGPAGENGVTPHIGTNGNWYIGSVNTGVSAKGAKGDNGLDGNGIKSAILNSDYTLTLTFDDGTTYTTPSIRGATGSSGKDGPAGAAGKDGTDGVGIASIEQTATSTADGGNNVFTVTLTNGTTATFTVKNGSKGSTGKDGSNGVDGGHYTPVVTQPTTDTMQISFAPSKSDMPAVNTVTVNLPVSENSGQTLTLDNTLTQSGQAADAKTTGDEIRRVEGLIPSIEGLAKTKDVPTKPEDIGAQPAGHYLTEAPVKSVNGKTGDVEFNASDVEGVAYIAQELTEEQQTQARHNIGAVSMEEVKALITGEDVGFSETGELVELAVGEDVALEVISKINRDETWGESNRLVLHQVSGSNFVDMTAFLGGAGTVIEKNGVTATINDDGTVTICGTNESTSRTSIINKYHWSGEISARVYPAGTYTIPGGFTMAVRAAQYPENVAISGVGNLSNTVTIPEPFRIIMMQYGVGAGSTIDVTLPLGLFRGGSVPENDSVYSGTLHTVEFDRPVYEGSFNWRTGELKDENGNTIAYYNVPEIKSLPGVNHFWTGFGENTVSNAPVDLGKVILRLNESAPEETVTSICDFALTPTTPLATYCLHSEKVRNGGAFFTHEIPLATTKGNLIITSSSGETLMKKYVKPLINWRGVSDSLTHKGLHKAWSDRFYFTKEPVVQEDFAYDGGISNSVYTFEFTENDFQNTGIPAKLPNIPIVSPCFYTDADATSRLNERVFGGSTFPATFSWNDESGTYLFKVRGLYPGYIMEQIQHYTKAYFCYQLATPHDISETVAMGVSSGDTVTFVVDDSDWRPYVDGGLYNDAPDDATPTCAVLVPRNPVDACGGMVNAARMLNTAGGSAIGDATVQGYSWIGAGDGVTDYTAKIQNKLDVLHATSGGGTIRLGPGTYPISSSLIVYGNTQIIGDGHTVIEQRADNTHAVIWNGSRIRMQDLTIKLAGKCTEITACIYANSHNVPGGNRDERYPENESVQFCATDNVTLTGDYKFAWDEEYVYLPDDALTYRGVGVSSHSMYFNYYDAAKLVCRNLYAGIHNGGSANNYRVYVTDSRYAVRGGGANNIFEITGHSYYGYGRDGQRVVGTEYAFYGTDADNNMITIEFYDVQYARGAIFFEGRSQQNHYRVMPSTTGLSTGTSTHWGGEGFAIVTDYGRGNIRIQPYRERFVGVGSYLPAISGLPYWNTQFNPSVHNALSGAGVWGTITSNINWTANGNIALSDVCRYPKETWKTQLGLASVVSVVSPNNDAPIDIIIDISDRPVSNYHGFWIQFDHRYVAEEYTVSFDTTNDGTFNLEAASIRGNIEPVSYQLNYQKASLMVYRVKVSITKALQIPEYRYSTSDYTEHTVNYNPDGLIGIVNIGMPSNEAYGRAFLGECGGSLYGNVDMHSNTLKNLPTPVDDGDAVSKTYLEERVRSLGKMSVVDDNAGNVTLIIGQ